MAAAVLTVLLAAGGCGGSTDSRSDSADGGGVDVVAEECHRPAAAPETLTYRSVPDVDPNLTSVDVYRLADGCDDRPVVFWIHGGGWSTGDKASGAITQKAAWAAENDWVLVSVNYRLSTPGAGVVYPVHGEDVAAAVAFTLDRADDLGIDPTRVAVLGHSAGAHLAAMVSVDPDLLRDEGRSREDIDCLVALDTEGYDLQERLDTGSDLTDALVANAFGTDPAELAAASPELVLEGAGGPVADAVIITRGLPKRRQQAGEFAAALRAAGSSADVLAVDGYSHADVNDALGRPGETVETPTVTAFLHTCLA